MKTCPHCSGELLRHGVTRYKDVETVGIRYRCRECSKTFTERMDSDKRAGSLFFAPTGRPTIKDWRYA